MKIAVMQLNPTIGAIEENLSKAISKLKNVHDKCDLAVFSELYLTGYPPRDLLERPLFNDRIRSAIERLEKESLCLDCGIIMGTPLPLKDVPRGLHNSAVFIFNGRTIYRAHKSLLPFYDVFDETRYFTPAPERNIFTFKGKRMGLSICEDMWTDQCLWPEHPYELDPISELARQGVDMMINISASPFHSGKDDFRYKLAKGHAVRNGVPFLFVNQVGGNDELVFDGNSMVLDRKGDLIAKGAPFKEEVIIVETNSSGNIEFVPQERIKSTHDALVMGLRDYMEKCGFKQIIVGHSGGIDSAVCCALASEAVGPGNVTACSMPSEYSSPESCFLAREMASKTGMKYCEIPITGIYQSYKKSLKDALTIEESDDVGAYLQNIQARIRGGILMAFSNRYGKLLISTGNKSELAVGYCTLYGDMAGGLALISDVPKTDVYKLAGYINKDKEVIPDRILKRAPSAELAPGQKDIDNLPDYEILDRILFLYLEKHNSPKEIIASGIGKTTVDWVVNAVNRNEYKRRQMPPGLKVASKAFGTGRRMPIAAKFQREDENDE